MKQLFLFFLLTLSTSLFAQSSANVIFGGSAFAYRGDLQENYDKLSGGFHIGLQLNTQKRVSPELLIQLGSVTGQNLKGNNAGNSANTFVKTSVFGVQAGLHIKLIRKEKWNIFLSQGVGLIRFQPKDSQGNNLVDLTDTRNSGESYSTNAFMLPTALGASYLLPNKMTFSLRFGYLNPQTDYIDNISQLGKDQASDKILQTHFSVSVPF